MGHKSNRKSGRHRSRSPSSSSTHKKHTHTPSTNNMTARDFQNYRVNLLKDELGYTNDNNPFGDNKLTDLFVWKKKNKIQKIKGNGTHISTIDKLTEHTHRKLDEIAMVKERREKREIEQKMLEEQRELFERERQAEQFEDFAHKEEEFHRKQILQKTDIRIQQGREQPIDILMKGIQILKGKTYTLTSPSTLNIPATQIFEDLSIEDVEKILSDIEVFVDDENIDEYKTFWNSLTVIGQETVKTLKQHKLEKEAQQNSTSIAPFRDVNLQIPLAIINQIDNLLSNKTSHQLIALESQVSHKLAHISDDVDPTYWETIQIRLPLFKAKAIINEVKEKWLTKINEMNLKENTSKTISPIPSKVSPYVPTPKSTHTIEEDIEENVGQYSPVLDPYDEDDDDEEDTHTQDHINVYSPSLHPFDEFDNEELIDPVDDLNDRLEIRQNLIKFERQKRLEIIKSYTHTPKEEDDIIDPAHKMTTFDDFVRKEKRMMEGDEEVMTSHMEHKLDNHYQWEEKYRPRKPRYFNRVKSGYEWSKYNQTHYDKDNPPPKAVQGYKFNIFYPNLINTHIAPTWILEPCQGTHDTVIIRFHAGPPYEDVAFKIINREWALDATRGFRNTFDKGILQLHFTFKRYRYRR